MKRLESRKSHSWWWDSHISPKNSKWLEENIEEMDQSVKRMLNLIEEDGDSFAKKAEMYYQKRPELISHVEAFYRMYRSLAERYDHVTGELKKNIPSDFQSQLEYRKNVPTDAQSQTSCVSDVGSEPPSSTWPSPDQRISRRKSGPRAAGFEFFLGSGGGSSDFYHKEAEGDEMSSSLSSDSESDDSSVNNYPERNGSEQELRRKIIELEVELRDTREKFRVHEGEDADGSHRGPKNGNSKDPFVRIAGYEEELRVAKENNRLLEEEIARLKMELQKYTEFSHDFLGEHEPTEKDFKTPRAVLEYDEKQDSELHDQKIEELMEELRITQERLQVSEEEIASLRHELESNKASEAETFCHLHDQLELAQKDAADCKALLNAERREVSKLQDRIARYKTNLSDREQEIRGLKVAVSEAEDNFSLERTQLQAKISKLLTVQTLLEEKLKESELHCLILEEELKRIKAEKTEKECLHEATEKSLNNEIEHLKAEVSDKCDRMEDLSKALGVLKSKYEMLLSERDELNAKIGILITEVSSIEDRMNIMDEHLDHLHMERAELVAETEDARKLVEELSSRVKELEKEVEKQRETISEGAEEKREAIRQLCFSLEHYRDGYHQLRQAFIGHRARLPVLAS